MSILFIITILAISALLSWPLGNAMTWAMNPRETAGAFRSRMETVFRKFGGRITDEEQNWKRYCLSMLLFNGVMFAVVYAILSLQQLLPFNPDGNRSSCAEPGLPYRGFVHHEHESSALFGRGFHELFLPDRGVHVAAIRLRCHRYRRAHRPGPRTGGQYRAGEFLQGPPEGDFSRAAAVGGGASILLVLGGVPMTLEGAAVATTLEGAVQTIASGPVAAFVAIKQLGTNGGGFFGPNSAHPFENPTFFTNMIECVCILLIPMASVWMFGRITGRMRHAAIVFAGHGFASGEHGGACRSLRKRSDRGLCRTSRGSRAQPGRQGTSLRPRLPDRCGPSPRRPPATDRWTACTTASIR